MKYDSTLEGRVPAAVIPGAPLIAAGCGHTDRNTADLRVIRASMDAPLVNVHTTEGEVDIEIAADRLTISDSGPGIPEHGIEQLFASFHRAGNENASGHDIRLTAIKHVCDRFGW